jgi:hypothetical protein
MYANDMGPDCLANKLKLPNSGWTVKVYPWLVKDAKGKEQSIWEDRYPLKVCLAKRAEMYERGSGDDYEREFMCSSARPESRIFRDEMQKVDARVRVYEPVNVMIVPEPMHSGTQIAACAGAAWSWVKDKLIVWELWSRRLAASEIVVEAQRMDALYRPVNIGVLHQPWHDWLHASLSLPNIVPLRPLANDLDFIRALQPFLANKQVIFAEDVAQAWSQFLAFPNGQIEAPRALAFALHPAMRQAQPMYGDFDTSNILPDMAMESGPATLVISASDRLVAGALCQAGGRGLRIFADWMEEGDPSEIAPRILQSANLTALRHCNIIMPARCFERGKDRLAAALRRMGIQASAGADEAIGRDELRRMLREQARGLPRLMVWDTARWTLSAFLAGYQTDTDEGPYKLAMEGVEALASLMAIGGLDDDARTNATARDGRAYFSARPVERVR